MEDPIIPICNRPSLLIATAPLLGLLIAAAPPRMPTPSSIRLSAYIDARAAEIQGDEARSARIYAAMAAADPADQMIARRAVAAAIQSGQADLAVSLSRRLKPSELPVDARLMLAADALRRGKSGEAIAELERGATSTEVELFAPMLRAWDHTARGRSDGIASLTMLNANSPLGAVADQQRAAMLFVLGKPDEALPIATRVVTRNGGRNARLRLAYADALQRLGRTEAAHAMLDGDDQALVAGRALLTARRPLGAAIATPAAGFAELLVALAVDLGRDENKALPISLTQVARHADPGSSEATLLLGLLLNGDKRDDDALAVLATIPAADPLSGDALDLETQLLSDAKQFDAALKRARAATASPAAGAADFGRLGAIYADMERHGDAAAAYADAVKRSPANSWTMRLLRAASLEQIDRWPEARTELETALRTEPDNAVLLNFLGYGKLERGEDLDAAEAMIRKASALKPDDASITDSLGWAMYKRGRLPEAVATLTRAAAGDPGQAEIHEHLGDALFASGRRIEARFSWSAALLTAEEKDKARLQGKLDSGLTAATAAP